MYISQIYQTRTGFKMKSDLTNLLHWSYALVLEAYWQWYHQNRGVLFSSISSNYRSMRKLHWILLQRNTRTFSMGSRKAKRIQEGLLSIKCPIIWFSLLCLKVFLIISWQDNYIAPRTIAPGTIAPEQFPLGQLSPKKFSLTNTFVRTILQWDKFSRGLNFAV